MGRDKALLPFQGVPLASWIASRVCLAAGSVTLLGDPARFAHLGFPVVPDPVPDLGPLAGLTAALRISPADWNLLVACDLPRIHPDLFEAFFHAAEQSTKMALVPCHPDGHREPLCALYHRAALPYAERALELGELSMQKLLKNIELEEWPISDPDPFFNANTPAGWRSVGGLLD